MRHNYHLMFIQNQTFPINMKTAICHTLYRLGAGFSEDFRFRGNSSTVSFAIFALKQGA